MSKFLPRTNINMQQHLSGLINGDKYNIAYGHWVIYREYDHSKRSKYWNDNLKEAVGGDKFEYTDIMIRTRRFRQGITRRGTSEEFQPLLEGILEPEDHIYYVEVRNYDLCIDGEIINRRINTKIEDAILEIDKYEGNDQPKPPYKVLKKMEVKFVEEIRGDFGRTEYWLLVVKDSPTRY